MAASTPWFHIAFVLSYAWHVFLDSYTVNVTYEYWTFEIRFIGFIHFLTNIEMMQLSHVLSGQWQRTYGMIANEA